MNMKDQQMIRQIVREELIAFHTEKGNVDMKEITYKDDMTFAEAWQKLIVDANIPHWKGVDVKGFYPIDKKGNKIDEKPTGKMVTHRTPNVLDLAPGMCNKSANQLLEEGGDFLPPVAYLHWLAELGKEGKHLDENTVTMFPNFRNENGGVPNLDFFTVNREVDVYDCNPDSADGNLGSRIALE